MSAQTRSKFAGRLLFVTLPIALLGASAAAGTGSSEPVTNPMRFFEGQTESVSTVKLLAKKPFKSRSIGRGEIRPDGTLHLVQRVEEHGRPPFDRSWRIRQVAPGRFSGTMSEAQGPVTAEEIGGRFRFRFKMKGKVSVEQWLTPLPGGRAAASKTVIRKFGMTVGRSEGMVRKL